MDKQCVVWFSSCSVNYMYNNAKHCELVIFLGMFRKNHEKSMKHTKLL